MAMAGGESGSQNRGHILKELLCLVEEPETHPVNDGEQSKNIKQVNDNPV